MTTLGAIFAGGAARRFGSDKAAALLDGLALIDHVAARLRSQCDSIAVVGRDWPGYHRIDDRPAHGLGPLGALAGALIHARERGYRNVLTSGCDLPDLPVDLHARLSPGPAVVAGQPLLGLWPVALADPLLALLADTDDRSMRHWIGVTGARSITIDRPLSNINDPAALARLQASRRD